MIVFVISALCMLATSAEAGWDLLSGKFRVGTSPDPTRILGTTTPSAPLFAVIFGVLSIFMAFIGLVPWFWVGVEFASSVVAFLVGYLIKLLLSNAKSAE